MGVGEAGIRVDDVVTVDCDHCGIKTVQVLGGRGLRVGLLGEAACLQCIADGGDCCSLEPMHRPKTEAEAVELRNRREPSEGSADAAPAPGSGDGGSE